MSKRQAFLEKLDDLIRDAQHVQESIENVKIAQPGDDLDEALEEAADAIEILMGDWNDLEEATI
jgi:hypothetical protein